MEIGKRKIWIAALLNILLPGLGYIYCGAAKRGIIVYFGVLIIFLPILNPVWFLSDKPLNIFIFFFMVILFYSLIILDVILIANKNKSEYTLKFYNKWYCYLIILIVDVFMLSPLYKLPIKTFISKGYRNPSVSMAPTLQPGDYFLSNNYIYRFQEPKRGDIVVFKSPKGEKKEFVKRIVAIGGDIVEIKSKILYINNKPVDEPYKVISDQNVITSEQNQRDNLKPIEVPDDSYFVLGDNRDFSFDSRFFGLINSNSIKGKVSSIYFSWDMDGFKCRWNRIGNTF